MTAEVVVLSPHFDDAVLSCWAELEQHKASVVTVFSGIPPNDIPSAWDRSTGFVSASAAMETRRSENETALAVAGAEAVNLGLLERSYRDAPIDPHHLAELFADVAGGRPLVAPAALGRLGRSHLDHIHVRTAAQILAARGHEVRYYLDLPYMLPLIRTRRWPHRLAANTLCESLGGTFHLTAIELTSRQRDAKRQACRAYESQFARVNRSSFGALSRAGTYRWEAMLDAG